MYREEGRTAKLYIISLAAGQFTVCTEGRGGLPSCTSSPRQQVSSCTERGGGLPSCTMYIISLAAGQFMYR
jgi:hypothetical protein